VPSRSLNISYETLAHKPGAFTSMTGLTIDEFEDLLADLRPRDEVARQERYVATPRRRAPGDGAKPRYALRERLLMTLVWLPPVSDRGRGGRPLRRG